MKSFSYIKHYLFYILRSYTMKFKYFLLIAIAVAMWQTAYSQLNKVWYKAVPSAGVETVTFSHNSRWIMVWPAQEDSMVYETNTGNLVKARIPSYVQYPFFSLDDSHVFGMTGNRIANINLTTGIDEPKFEPADSILTTRAVLSEDGRYILSGTINNKILVWDTQTGKIVKSKRLYPDNYDHMSIDSTDFFAEIQQIGITCDNSKIVVKEFSNFRKLRYRYEEKGQPKAKYDTKMFMKLNVYDFNSLDSVGCLFNAPVVAYFGYFVLSHDCLKIAFRFQDNNYAVRVYDFNSMQELTKLNFSGIARTNIKFTPDNKYIVSASGMQVDNLIIWDVLTGKALVQRPNASYWTVDVSNDLDGQYIASSGLYDLIIFKFPILGISSPSGNSKEILYPNPSTGILTVNLNLPVTSSLMIDLTDLNGKLTANVYQQLTEQGISNIQIDLSGYANGTYLLRLRATNYEKVYKVIITK